mmetsp:Transcript_49805/g.83496  ORF Transcript_49805/g.83496 Transcript_49805/m.83496 type:complete len:253 (+) Transcript_49805:833-1591(+)
MHNAKNDDETRQNLKTDRPRQYAECHVSDHAKGLMLERVLSHRPKPGFRRMVEMSTTPNPTSTSRRNYVPTHPQSLIYFYRTDAVAGESLRHSLDVHQLFFVHLVDLALGTLRQRVAQLVDLVVRLLQLAAQLRVTQVVGCQDLGSDFFQLRGSSPQLVAQRLQARVGLFQKLLDTVRGDAQLWCALRGLWQLHSRRRSRCRWSLHRWHHWHCRSHELWSRGHAIAVWTSRKHADSDCKRGRKKIDSRHGQG